MEDACFALPRFELMDQDSFYSSTSPMNHSPILLSASDPSFKRPRAGQPSAGARSLPGWGPSHFPFHILSIYFSSTSSLSHLGPHLPLRHPLFHSYLILSSQAQGQLSTSSIRMRYSKQTCSQALQAPHSFIPHLGGYGHHETPCLQSHCSPHSARSSP